MSNLAKVPFTSIFGRIKWSMNGDRGKLGEKEERRMVSLSDTIVNKRGPRKLRNSS